MLAFDSDLPPVVGQQVTMTNTSRNDSNVNARVNLLEARCRADLRVVPSRAPARGSATWWRRAIVGGVGTTWRLISSGSNAGQYFENNTTTRRTSTYVRDRANTAGQPVTWTAVPYGSGTRIAGDLQ